MAASLRLAALAALAALASAAPCDIFAAAGTPCVCAHSVVRALYSAYNGPLYLLRRASDSYTAVVATTGPGGFANVATQAAFCAGTSCVIWRIFDQSPFANDLSIAPPGGYVPHIDNGVNASRWPISIGGNRVFGAYFEGAMGYRIDATNSVATGNDAETLYMVTSGTHVNGGACAGGAHVQARGLPARSRVRAVARPLLRAHLASNQRRRISPLRARARARRMLLRLWQRGVRQPRRRRGHDGGGLLRNVHRLGQGARQRALGHDGCGEWPLFGEHKGER